MKQLLLLLPLLLLQPGLQASEAPAPAPAPVATAAIAPAPASSLSAAIARARVAGVDVLCYRMGVHDVVTVRGSLPAGDSHCPPGNPAVATLTGMLLDKGTLSRDKFAIAAQLEAVGAELSFSVGAVTTEFSGKCLTKDLPLLISVLAEQLRSPAFHQEELDKMKAQFIGGLRRRLESTDARAGEAFSRVLFPEGHPNREASVAEMIAAAEKTTLEEVRAFHAAHFGPARLVIVGVGDLDAAVLQREVKASFEGWKGGEQLAPSTPAPVTVASTTRVEMAEKTSVSVIIGQATRLRYSDPDNLALRVGTAILGGGFTGRLMSTVRDKEGLTYGIYSSVAADTFCDGQWQLTATFAPAMLERGLASARRELQLWHEKGVTADELDRRKSNIIGSFKVGLSTTGGLASQILITIDRGYGLDWLDEFPRRLQALTVEQVNAAIRRHLDPAAMAVVLAGTLPAQK